MVVIAPVSANDFYVGANIGSVSQNGEFEVNDTNINPSVGINAVADYQAPDDNASNHSLFMGYRLGADSSLELGYANNGSIESDARSFGVGTNNVIETAETSYMYVSFVGIWPIENSWAFNARLGFSVWDIDYMQLEVDPALSSSDAGYVINEQAFSDNTASMFIGIGVNYGFSKDVEILVNLENHFVDFSFTNLELDYDTMVFTLGVAYHF